MPVLLQINMGKEESKSGFFIEEIENAILDIQSLDNVKIEGLMAVMPICDKENTIKLFEQLKAKWCELKDKYNFKYLSAGMTNDYELAIEFADISWVSFPIWTLRLLISCSVIAWISVLLCII